MSIPKFKVGDKVLIVSNTLPPNEHEYHFIPVNSIGEIVDLDIKQSKSYGPCYEVYEKKYHNRQYVYESNLRALTPSDHPQKTQRQELPDI